VTNTRLIVHMALVVPPRAASGGRRTREWREGRAWVFDDTSSTRHGTRATSAHRSHLDVWNSFLAPAERDLVGVLTAGVHEYGEGESPFRQGG